MSSPAKQQPSSQQKKGGWGSLLSGAVAGLESRLDTILADEPEDANKQAKASGVDDSKSQTASNNAGGLLPAPTKGKDGSSRDTSRTRTNDRLAERLAKATAAKTPTPSASNVPSRVGSPAIIGTMESPRASGEEKRSSEVVRSVPDITGPTATAVDEETQDVDTMGDGDSSNLIDLPNSARLSGEISSRPSLAELPNGNLHDTMKINAELGAESNREEEMHAYLEKIDALQAKLSYLANETVAAAKAANAAETTNMEKNALAEKDEKIALLMQEGEQLSKTELKHLQTIKKLRAKNAEDEKAAADNRRKAEKVESELRQRLRKAEVEGRQAFDKAKQIAAIEKEVEELRVDRENAAELVKSLTVQLKEAKDKAEKAGEKANEVDKGRIAALENELEDAQIEKRLAEDRAKAEVRKVKEDTEGQKQRSSVRELELKNEIAGLESRVEAMRSRAEEATAADGGVGAGENSNLALLRQVETLQRQYALAKENWEAIGASLNGRVAALERERDEANRRESEARKRARELGVKARRFEDELEGKVEEVRMLNEGLREQQNLVESLSAQFEQNQNALEDAQGEFERHRRLWEAEVQQRVEEEKSKWQQEGRQVPATTKRNGSLATNTMNSSRRPGTGEGNRLNLQGLAALHTETQRSSSGKGSAQTPATSTKAQHLAQNSGEPFSVLSRQESAASLHTPTEMPPTPSIELNDRQDPFENHHHHRRSSLDNNNNSPHSPDLTINDLISASASGTTTAPSAGPSVQLVERMSAAVRRLESEKAASKDEIARLSSQRDSARDEVVALMREVEAKREFEKREGIVKEELGVLRARYEASLEMLGEREEEVGELKSDVGELKRLYRELVEEKLGGSGGGAGK